MSSLVSRPSREDRIVTAISSILTRIMLSVVDGALLMLFLSCAHQAEPRVPALGFITCAFLCLALTGAVSSALVLQSVERKRR